MINPIYTAMAIALVSFGAASKAEPLQAFEELTPASTLEAPAPDPQRAAVYGEQEVAHGRYLVSLLGCGTCHTDGALIGQANTRARLAGSSIGIAYSNPLKYEYPGIVYPANLTPDPRTGLGTWTTEEIGRVIRSGVDRHGRQQLSVMPWPAFARISDADARAIAVYLRSLPPVEFEVPANVKRGEPASAPFVHFGVYRSVR